MLTREESEYLRRIVAEYEQHDGIRIDMMRAINRATDVYAPNQGTDVIAKGPNKSSQHMLDEAARALGWRTDFATGDSPVTWELVLEEIRKRTRMKVVEVMDCPNCRGRLVIKERRGNRVVAVCIDGGCGVSWNTGFLAQAEAAKKMQDAITKMTKCLACGGPYELKEDLGSIKIYNCTKCKVEVTVE